MHGTVALPAFDFQQRTRLIYGPGTLETQLVPAVRELRCSTALLVTDAGLRQAGHATRAEKLLRDAGLHCHVYDDVHENPTSDDVDACTAFAKARGADVLIGLGGGSSMDCAKGANFLLTNGPGWPEPSRAGTAASPGTPDSLAETNLPAISSPELPTQAGCPWFPDLPGCGGAAGLAAAVAAEQQRGHGRRRVL